jgi:hypothetical protein
MLIGTNHTVYTLNPGDAEPAIIYADGNVRCVAEGASLDVIALSDNRICIGRNNEWRSYETGITGSIESLLIVDEDPLRLLIGTEPPNLYEFSGDGPAVRNESFSQLECRNGWHTPWGGPAAVRSLAKTPDGSVYADIHVGSIMRSADNGVTWEPVVPELHEDVHQVATCPAAPEHVYADTAAAVYISHDRGNTWIHCSEDMNNRYGRAIVVHPSDPACILATVSDGPHGENVHGELWRTDDGGAHWEHITGRFPGSTTGNIDTFHIAFNREGIAWAIVDRQLFTGYDKASRWELCWTAPEPIGMISCV